MLNASQKRTNRAPFSEELMSRTPASWAGWLPTTPIGWPFRREKPTTMLRAKCSCTSKNSPSSTMYAITSRMS